MPIAQKRNDRYQTMPRWMMTATAVGLCLMMGAQKAKAEDAAVVAPTPDKPKVLSVPLAVTMAPGAITNQKIEAPEAVPAPAPIPDAPAPLQSGLVQSMMPTQVVAAAESASSAEPVATASVTDENYYAAPRPSLQIIQDNENTVNDLRAALSPRPPLIYSSEMPVRIDAQHLSYDDVAETVTATGNVEVVQDDKILRADKIVYNQKTDTVAASGNVTLLDDKGDVSYAEYAELTGNMKTGYIKGLLALLVDGSRFTAAEARHEDGNTTTMTNASYTPCEVCEENPEPIWQIKADKVVHDKEEKSIKYKNARLELLGVPMAFTPVFVHADPTVKRKSGFLRPRFGWTDEVGSYIEGGYYFGDIAPDMDATLQVRPTTRAGILAMGQWRQRFETGRIELNLSGVESDRLEEHGATDKDRWRGHIFANGLYDIDDKWRAGFNVEKASDKGYLRLYDISKENVLESEVYAERFSGRNYSRISGLSFQDVRLGVRPDQPEIFPRMEHRMVGEPGAMFGGRWTAGVSALALLRDENQQDMQRGSVDIGWERRDILPIGLTTQWNLGARGDFYSLQDRTAAVTNPGLDPDSRQGRGTAIASVTTSYPMVKRVPQGQIVVEPLVGASISPQNDEDDFGIPNEDSVDIQLDTSNLFAQSRFPGVDSQEDGARVTYGLKTGLYGDNGRFGKIFVGQSYRMDDDNVFPAGSGLEDNSSDVVGQVTLALSEYLRADYRFQLDNRHLSMRRNELQAYGGNDKFTANVGYIYVAGVAGTGFTESREQMSLGGSYRLTPEWTASAYTLTDLGQEPGLRKASLGIFYVDECFTFGIDGTRNLIRETSGESGTVIMMRLGLKNIGEISTPSIQLQSSTDGQ